MKRMLGVGIILLCGMVWWGESGIKRNNSLLIKKVPEERFGFLSDTHGDKEATQYFASQFVEQKVDAIILTGDIANKSSWFIEDGKGEEILRILGKTGLPVYVLPGNHDQRKYYEKAMEILAKEYPNLVDLLTYRRIDLPGVDFVSNPYGEGKSYFFSGYYSARSEKKELESLLSQPTQDPIVLLTHQHPLCKGEYGVDYTLERKNDGNANLDSIMKKYKIEFSFSGHIHSATNGCDQEGRSIPPKIFTSTLRLNPGAATKHETKNGDSKGYAAIVTIKEKKIMYELLVRD